MSNGGSITCKNRQIWLVLDLKGLLMEAFQSGVPEGWYVCQAERLFDLGTSSSISRGNPTSLLVPARPEMPARHSKRVPNFVSPPNIALPRNENRPGSWAAR